MKFRIRTVAVLLPLLGIVLTGCSKLKARDELNKGVRSFKDAKYETAVQHFQNAVNLDPDLLGARLYLATAYAAQYQPGGESEENKKLGEAAIKAFEEVLQKDPKSVGSVKGIAGIYFNMRDFENAKKYYKKTAELEPKTPEPFYSIGNVNWVLCYDKSHPLPPGKKSELIEEGIQSLNKAVENDPNYYNAYFYINLLLRQKAQVIVEELGEKNPKIKDQLTIAAMDPKAIEPLVRKYGGDRYNDYKNYLKEADDNFNKAMDVRKKVEAKAESKGVVDMSK